MFARRRVSKLFAGVAIVWLLVAAGPPPLSAQLEPAPTDPQLFDLELATKELTDIETRIHSLQQQIADTLDSIDGMTVERDFIDLNSSARAEALNNSRQDARNLAINAYIGISTPVSGFELLEAQTVSDLTWQHAVMRQQAARTSTAAETYAILAGQADEHMLGLSDEINAETRQLEALNRDLARAMSLVDTAEYFVYIAEIHREADLAFEKSKRSEPTAEQWRKLRFCESTETYSIDTGNSFYGAYQFTWETWGTVGGVGNPAHALAAEQDARARLLYARRGDQPWPICGRYLRR